MRAGLAFAALVAMSLSAQHARAAAEDTVVLKSGQVLTGKVLDDDPTGGVTIKLSSGKVQVVPAKDVKMVERSMSKAEASKKADPPAKKRAPEPPDDEPAPEKKPEEPKADEPEKATRRLGAGLALGAAISRANKDSSLTVLSPSIGLRGAYDVRFSPELSLRLEPELATFSRKSKLVAPIEVDTRVSPPIITSEEIVTRVRELTLSVGALAAVHYAGRFASRLGLVLGVARASASASAQRDPCADTSKTGALFGLRAHPITARFGAFEAGVNVEYVWVPMVRCDVGDLSGGLSFAANASSKLVPKPIATTLGVGVVGLTGTYFF